MRIVFMGTPQLSADILSILLQNNEIIAVFTREDKPVGRKQLLTPPPVKTVALAHQIPVFQPKRLDEAALDQLEKLNPELIVVVAYGRILPKKILALPKYGCINLHVSLLPKYRGAAPIQWAIINGENTTGITVMYMNEGLDTGDIIKTKPIEIAINNTAQDLFELVSLQGAPLLQEVIEKLQNGTIKRQRQDDSRATFAPMLTRENTVIDFEKTAKQVHDLVRGLNPAPLAYFIREGKKIKVLRTQISQLGGNVGEILSVKPLTVACGACAVTLLELVPEGKNAMSGTAYAAGARLKNHSFII